MSSFVPYRELSRRFFLEVAQPIIDNAFPGLRYAAALLGAGFDVLGFDTLGIGEPLPTKVQPFFDRPFATIATHGYAESIAAQIADPEARALLARPWIGNVDQVSDSTDVVETPVFRDALRRLYASS